VLNGRRGVSAETRARVEALINRHGYRKPPPISRSNLLGLVFRELESMWAVEIIRGVERVARGQRVAVLVSEYGLHDTAVPFWRAGRGGYWAAVEAAGLPTDADLVVRANLRQEDGYLAARALLARHDRPTAIFAANDLQALGVYRAARELELRIPDDLSVVGF